jgi:hypothetical protein
MPSLVIAFALAVAGVILSSLALTAVGLPKDISASISSVIMGGIPYIHKLIEARSKAKAQKSVSLLTFEGFGISAPLLTVYTSVLMFAAMQVGSGIGALAASFALLESGAENIRISLNAVLVTVFLITFPAVFFIGRWVGIRSKSHSILTILFSVFIARGVSSIIDYTTVSAQSFIEMYGVGKSVGQFTGQLIWGILVLSILSLIGYKIGSKRRLSSYFAYLLNTIKPEDREPLISLAYDEAKKTLSE